MVSPTSESGQIHLHPVVSPTSESGLIHLHPVVSPTSESGQIHLHPVVSPTSESGLIHLNLVVSPTSESGQIHLHTVVSPTSESGLIHLNLVVSPTSESGQIHLHTVVSPTSESGLIHLNLVAIILMPTIHLDRQRASPFSSQPSQFFPQPALSMLHSASFSSFDLQPQCIMPFSRHDHHPLQHITIPINTVIANWSMVSFKPNINIKSLVHVLFLSCVLHVALTNYLSFQHKFSSNFSQAPFHTELLA